MLGSATKVYPRIRRATSRLLVGASSLAFAASLACNNGGGQGVAAPSNSTTTSGTDGGGDSGGAGGADGTTVGSSNNASGNNASGNNASGNNASGNNATSGGNTTTNANNTASTTGAENGALTINPANANLTFGGRLQFSASEEVEWSIQEGEVGGTISDSGLYTAPASSGSFHVQATSSDDEESVATALVTVAAPAGTPPTLTQGVWTNLTPPESKHDRDGVIDVAVCAGDPRTLYITVNWDGIWKTTDGGSTWKRTGTPDFAGTNLHVGALDTPTMLECDPADSNHVYATEGVGGGFFGFWITTDGGDTWFQSENFADLAYNTTTNDVIALSVDPSDFKHVILSSHSPWKNMGNAGIMETVDAGMTWVAHPPEAGWPVGTLGVGILYHPDSGTGDPKTWLVTTDGAGFWRTTDGGGSWTKVSDIGGVHGGTDIYYNPEGVLYSGAMGHVARSADNGVTWEQLDTEYAWYFTVIGDGKNLYTAASPHHGDPIPFQTATEADPKNWEPYAGGAQTFTNGPSRMAFDATNRIIYSASWEAGLLALKVE